LGDASFSRFAFADLPKRATVRARLGDPLTGGRSSFIATDRSHLPASLAPARSGYTTTFP